MHLPGAMNALRICSCAVLLAACGPRKFDAEVWWMDNAGSTCEETQVGGVGTLCFAAGTPESTVYGTCMDLCRQSDIDPLDGHNRCPRGSTCVCRVWKDPQPDLSCTCSDSTRTLSQGC